MRLLFQNRNSNEQQQQKKFHKNLFLEEFDDAKSSSSSSTRKDVSDQSDNEYGFESDDDDYVNDFDKGNTRYTKFDKNPNIYRLKNIPVPLTDTIAEFVEELSEDKFFLNDISFIFELSRKRAISPYAIVVALIYLKRLKHKSIRSSSSSSSSSSTKSSFANSSCFNSSSSSSNYYTPFLMSNTELCLISILLASKYLIDEGEEEEIYNDDWAEATDFSIEKVNSLERNILKIMEWELFVSSEEFWRFTNELTEKITRKKIKLQQNQCTYSDLEFLLNNSKQFSLNILKNHLSLLTKLILIGSSTIMYIVLSSFVVSLFVFYLKNQIASLNRMKTETSLVFNKSVINTNISFESMENNVNYNIYKNDLMIETKKLVGNDEGSRSSFVLDMEPKYKNLFSNQQRVQIGSSKSFIKEKHLIMDNTYLKNVSNYDDSSTKSSTKSTCYYLNGKFNLFQFNFVKFIN